MRTVVGTGLLAEASQDRAAALSLRVEDLVGAQALIEEESNHFLATTPSVGA